MNREQAAEAFALVLHTVGIDQAYQTFFEGLNSPEGTGTGKEKYREIQEWYTSKASDEQQLIQRVLKEALALSVFGLAVHFDGAAGYDHVEDKVVEFSVGLSVYGTLENAEAGTALQTIVVCPTESGNEIHDILLSLVDEAEEAGGGS